MIWPFWDTPNNDDRADWAQEAADVFAETTFGQSFSDMIADDRDDGDYGDAPDVIADLICNLGHLAARHGFDPVELFNRGMANFAHESSPDYAGD